MQVGDKLRFNTGRGYTAEGQVIEAAITKISVDPDGFFDPVAHVEFNDLSRYIRHTVAVTTFDQASIMAEYDACRYLD
ncbi:MAG: hypothetical protein ACRCXH_13375 [Shewanella sp.]|uniref:hypothetical protein n=1 Tax=Shewanella sp. TaxID=50422 RepID=UPI003F3C68A6